MLHSSVIISVYRDIQALSLILQALSRQTIQGFEVIISQDGDDIEVINFVRDVDTTFPVIHLTQPDQGFQKNRALNRAILAANSERLIFIDGDCIPHDRFIESHLKHLTKGVVTAGRRVELGPNISQRVRQNAISLDNINSNAWWWTHIYSLIKDKTKGVELVLAPKAFIGTMLNRKIALLGSNFGAYKSDLITINGFNEEYKEAGIGEDTDIEWRLRECNVTLVNIKFSALQWHLYHERIYQLSDNNIKILLRTKQNHEIVATHGLNSHNISQDINQ